MHEVLPLKTNFARDCSRVRGTLASFYWNTALMFSLKEVGRDLLVFAHVADRREINSILNFSVPSFFCIELEFDVISIGRETKLERLSEWNVHGKADSLVATWLQYFHLSSMRSGAQLGISGGRGSVHKKGTITIFKDDATFEYCFADS